MPRPATAQLLTDQEYRIFGQAEWIWPYDHRWDLTNAYALFRHAFTLDRVPRRAPLFITADQSYQLYVNGAFVGRGPARGFQSNWPYDEVDISPWLVPGQNVIAVRAHNPGFSNFQYVHRGYAGLIAAARWGKVTLNTGKGWKCLVQPGVRRDMVRASLQLFAQENFDARVCPPDWMNSDFDDRDWSAPSTQKPGVLPWPGFAPRGIPRMFEEAWRPGRVIGLGEGDCGEAWRDSRNLYVLRQLEDHTHQSADLDAAHLEVPAAGPNRFRSYLIDLGKPVVGNFSLIVSGAQGGEVVDLVYTEVIDPAKLKPALRFPDGSSVSFSSRLVCRTGRTSHQFYHPYGFRYAMLVVRDSAGPLTITPTLRRTGYPLDRLGRFESSDRKLEQIWETCAWSQQNCMLDAYVDTPWREQAQWWGDARVQAWNTFHLSGDARLFRRGIYQIGGQTTGDGITYGHAPTMAHNCVLPDFTLTWIITQWDYYWQTGDLQPFRDHHAVVERALDYFRAHTGKHGLVQYDPRYWLFLDWTDLPRDGASSVYNFWLLIALERLAALHRLDRQPARAARCERWARQIRTRLKALVTPKGLMSDGYDANGRVLKSTSAHAQTLALMTDLKPTAAAAMERYLLDYLKDESGHTAQPSAYWITYVYAVLTSLGHGAEVVRHLRPRWEPMIAQGSTFELFKDHPAFPISHSHAWSAHPLFHLMAIIGGIRQTAPAWKRIHFAPVFIGESGGATVPTPQGSITSRWRRTAQGFEVELALPRGVTAEIHLPGHKPGTVKGRGRWTVAAATR